MYKKDLSFHTPDDSLIVWRYIDFTKYVDLLLSKELFFTRSDRFDDPFEGISKFKDYENTKHMLSTQQKTKKFYFLNCWHLNIKQSDAMWKIFLKTTNGIAIKTTVGNIKKSIENEKSDVFIGEVYYRDFDNVTFDEVMFEKQNRFGKGGNMNQFNYKRISFEHEKELRLFYIDLPIPHAIKNGIPRESLAYKKIKVNINELVNEIVIAPFADSWFKDLVKNITESLGYELMISKSELYNLNL